MRIEIVGDDSISHQARIYAEYRLFAVLSQVVDTSRVRSAALVLRRAKSRRQWDCVLCTVTLEFDNGAVTRLRASGTHPYGAINRAAERLGRNPCLFGTIRCTAKWPPPNEAPDAISG